MAFGIYIHLPYCVQRCHYCDFTTFEQHSILPKPQYLEMLKKEIAQRAAMVGPRSVDSIFFGGGTPSLFPAESIIDLLDELKKSGFKIGSHCEITIEINPATLSLKNLDLLIEAGVNRFSVGAQTFNTRHLDFLGRKHTVEETRETIKQLQGRDLNYSFDLMFALPHQSIEELEEDLDELRRIRPPHVSIYCLTLNQNHSLFKIQPDDEIQAKMFIYVSEALQKMGYEAYEISNFSLQGKSSRHNQIYWDDGEYWGIGLSAHSYLKPLKDNYKRSYGVRFHNSKSFSEYENQLKPPPFQEGSETAGKASIGVPEALSQFGFKNEQWEELTLEESLTDFCHVSLRRNRGLLLEELDSKYGFEKNWAHEIDLRLEGAINQGWVTRDKKGWILTPKGKLMSNQVFAKLLFT
jgi:oxygen-independent coproporphyrinogen III oxidase